MNSNSHPSTRPSSQRNASGFTLIEVLIAVTLLVFISFAIYRTVTQTFLLRSVLMEEGDFLNSIRLSMNLMERDLSNTLFPEMMSLPIPKASNIPNGGDQGQYGASSDSPGSKYWGGLIYPTKPWQMRHTVFLGTESSLSFISASHGRMYKDSPESIYGKVSYALKEKVWVRTFSTYVFDLERDDEPKPKVYELMKGIESLKMRFYRKETDQWTTQWDSTRTETKNIFPDLVEVSIHVRGGPRLTYEGKYFLRLEVPTHGIDPST